MEGKNEERGMAGVSYLRKLYVTVSGVTVTLMKSRRTLVSTMSDILLLQWLCTVILFFNNNLRIIEMSGDFLSRLGPFLFNFVSVYNVLYFYGLKIICRMSLS